MLESPPDEFMLTDLYFSSDTQQICLLFVRHVIHTLKPTKS